ncbi:MAG: 1-acyl-sn-glycerol-3-phosphate acyltransferase [Lachnospiraceae bacterium]|nr:1-acyl-sn-glycerol-3-phosphate acyltransferase [Lachnospiraceae bacterium]
MVRLILVLLFIILFLLVSIPILLILWIIGLIRPAIREHASLAIVSWAFRVITWLAGVRLTIRGEENIPANEGVLFIGNHRSYFDIVLAYGHMNRLTGFIAKKQIRVVPILNLWMLNLHCLFLDRDDLKQGLEMIGKASDLVRQGVSIMIYPEGTRNKTEDALLPFHRGSFRIAQKTGCKIIPVVVTHTDEIYEKHRPFIRSAHVTMTYCPPIDTSTMEMKERKVVDTQVRAVMEAQYFADLQPEKA